MGSTQPLLRRALALAITPVLVAGGLVLSAGTASAATSTPTPVSSTALPTVQINGVAWAQVVTNGVVYVGGQFSASRPAGAAAGVNETGRANLLAYDVSTGEAIAGFGATTNGAVRAIAASSDGSRIYIAGTFTQVNGQARYRVAALSPSGQLLSDFAPTVNGSVSALAVRGSAVYLGGTFTQVAGLARARAAAVSSTGAVLAWNPNVGDYAVKAITVSPDSTKVLLGGSFSTVNGKVGYYGIAAVDATAGTVLPWGANSILRDYGDNSAVLSLASRGGVAYATTYWYTKGAGAGGNLEGGLAMNWSDGSIVWVDACHGDTYSGVVFNDAFYTAGHAHDCSPIGGFAQTDPISYRRAIAFSTAPGSRSVSEANSNWNGKPAPNILDWYPEMNAGTYTGLSQGPWSVSAGSGFLVYGGEFTKVNGTKQQGLVRFQGAAEAGDPVTIPTPTATPTPTPTPTDTSTPTPTTGPAQPGKAASAPNRVAHPNAVPLGPTRVAVKWSAPKAAKADEVTSYIVKAYKGAKVVKTVKVGGSKRLAVITGLKKSTSYRIGVAAKNSVGTGKLSVLDGARTKAKGKNVSATKKPSKVAKPKVGTGKSKVRVRWSGASAKGALAVSKYQIRFVKAGKTVKVITVSAKARSRLVTGLGRHAAYSISVRAGSWAGWSGWSTGKKASTR